MSLDLGVLVGHVLIEDTQFQRTYIKLVRQFGSLGDQAAKSAQGTATLDEALAGTAASADKAAAGLGRASKASAQESTVATKAALAEERRATAIAQVAAVMAPLAEATAKDQQVALRDVAAQNRLTVAREGASSAAGQQASATARVASAQAAAIGAAERAATSQGKLAAAFSGTVKMAAQLGILFGAFEAVKKVIDIGKQAGDYQRQMLLIQTQTHGSAAEVRYMSGAVLGLAGDVGILPDKLAQAVYHFESIGVRGPAALKALTIAAEGAQIGNANLDDTTQALVYTLQSGITGVSDLGQAMAVFNTIVGSGDMTMQQLVEALGSHGLLANAKASGASIQEVGAALAVLGDNGVKGVNASTGLIQIFNDLLKPAQGSADALSAIGLSADELRSAMSEHGLNNALQMLHSHLVAAGDTGTKLKGVLVDIFTKRASSNLSIILGNMDLWDQKLAINTKAAGDFGSMWAQTAQTSRVALDKVGAGLDATGVKIATNVLPDVSALAQWFGKELPSAVSVLTGVLGGPLATAWGVVTTGFRLAGDVIGPVISLLDDIKGPIGDVTLLVGGMWLAFKAGELAAVLLTNLVTWIGQIPAKATAMATSVRASVSDYVASMGQIGASTEGAAVVAGTAMGAISDEAALMSGTVVAEGEAATVGWAGLLGPLLAVGVGIALLVSMFHKSDSASRAAAAAAKAYTDALQNPGTDPNATIVGAIVKQLKDNDVPAQLDAVNKALGRTALTGGQFVTAIEKGGAPLDALRTKLQAIADASWSTKVSANGRVVTRSMNETGQAALNLLGTLDSQSSGMSKAAAKELEAAKSFHMTASSVGEVSSQMQIGDKTAQGYLGMLGILVDKNGIAAASSTTVKNALSEVRYTLGHSTETLDGFTKAWTTFSTSAGTAADRAALIGATLKAANGDALNYAAAINAAASADHQLVTDLRQAASQVGKSGESMRSYIGSIVNLKTGVIDYNKSAAGPLISGLQGEQTAAMAAAQAAFQHARATKSGKVAADEAYKVYVSRTRGALLDQHKQLGLTAGQAKKLADQYFGMPKDVKTMIESEGADPVLTVLNKIGKLLADVFGVKWNLKADPSQAAAAADAARRKWYDTASKIEAFRPNLNVNDGPALSAMIHAANIWNSLHDKTLHLSVVGGSLSVGARGAIGGSLLASGGSMPDGYSTVGEGGPGARPELVFKRGSTVQVYSHAASKQIVAATGLDAPGMRPIPGFATGTDPAVQKKVYGPFGSGVLGVADLLKSQIPGSAAAMKLLSQAVNAAFDLKGVRTQLADAKTALTDMAAKVAGVRSGVTQALGGGASQFTSAGSFADLMAALSSGTAVNKAYSGEVKKLSREGLDQTYLRNLEQSGQTATLQTLAGLSKHQIAQVNKSVGGFRGSLSAAADTAVMQTGYGVKQAEDQRRVDQLQTQQSELVAGIDKLVAGISRLTGRPVELTIDGKMIAKTIVDPELVKIVDSLGHHLTYKRKKH